jgi:hypothetical protein
MMALFPIIGRHPRAGGDPSPQPSEVTGPRLRGDDDQSAGSTRKTIDPATAKVARQFESLFVAQMLKSARAASLGDDLTGKGGATFNDLADQLRAEALSAQAPLGVARLLAK